MGPAGAGFSEAFGGGVALAGAPGLGAGVKSFCTLMVPSAARSTSPTGCLSRIRATRARVGHAKSMPLMSRRCRRSGASLPSGSFTARSVAQALPRDSAVSLPLTIRTRFWVSALKRPEKLAGNGK